MLRQAQRYLGCPGIWQLAAVGAGTFVAAWLGGRPVGSGGARLNGRAAPEVQTVLAHRPAINGPHVTERRHSRRLTRGCDLSVPSPRADVAVRESRTQVDFLTHYSKRPDLLDDLDRTVARLGQLQAEDEPSKRVSVQSESVPSTRRVADRLSAEDISTLIAKFKAGMTVMQLTELYGIGRSSVKTLLRKHGVRRCDQ
jgi:hypothetical protein